MRISSSVRSRSARTGAKVAVAVAVAGATLAGAPAAYALPGDSGNIDIRSVSWHSRGDRDGVEVCKFVLAASNFESFPSVPWTITEQPPTVPPGTTLLDTLPLINGSARSETYLLPEGTYQLVWVVPAGPKQKSFKVECPDRGHGGGKPHKPQKPIGAVPAGGGGVPDMESVSSESDSNAGTAAAALVAGAAGAAGLVMMRRRRARGEA
ncbi:MULTISPECIES: hypothetical protein [Streptomyces]|uniref:LPXTG cell wall anchor domain-containing protein n=1 Tax=Streptomyces cyaneofuscatus TaxID=66883 RepID=A0ABZ1EPI5_9ACTN|nr:hypothetical protein [Streptomyces cyaneofuscatus]WSB05971.1 hypothetical protein OG849_01270 [Streptomyces cyaneofuscatus]WSD50494.1 hypothetical protein OG857_34140 [Streptomyces cyaneofuscatus]WTA93987.1 hypothetical protein OG323_35785 [Streptomyces cyaneofuscatus]